MGTVRLNDMQFHAFHGCLEMEREIGNRFSVDVEFDYPLMLAAKFDSLADAVDYAEIHSIVKKEMALPSNLLENVAWRILEAIRLNFPCITRAEVTVTKFNPPVDGQVGSSSVTVDYGRK